MIGEGNLAELGDIRLTVMETPGHTAGSSSDTTQVPEGGRDYDVVITNMGTINPGKKLVGDPTWPGVPIWNNSAPRDAEDMTTKSYMLLLLTLGDYVISTQARWLPE